MQTQNVILTNGRPMCCSFDVDAHGFILYGIHDAEGDETVISAAEYDNIEQQVMSNPLTQRPHP